MALFSASFLVGLTIIHCTSSLHWYQTLTPLGLNHCPETGGEGNFCYDLIQSSNNCSYICEYARPLEFFLRDIYNLCEHPEWPSSKNIRCHYYQCQRKCCSGWALDDYGRCTVESKGIECLNGGTPFGDNCICPKHFVGKQCETAVCGGECLNGGECRKVDPLSPPKCICSANFTGHLCEKPVCGDGCQNGGSCISQYYGVACKCQHGFLGPWCEKRRCDKCHFIHGNYDTSCSHTCKSDDDCQREETCCEHEGRNICVVKREKAHQKCIYGRKAVYVGESITNISGKKCLCMPGYIYGSLNCDEDVCEEDDEEENTCIHHGDGIMHDNDKVEEEISDDILYELPRIYNCPSTYSRVMVEVQEDSNVALMYHQFKAINYLGRELQVYVSQQKFYACNCSYGQRVRANATAVDQHGGKTICCFTVQIVDRYPPKLSHCPVDIYAIAGERISWTIPKATDNVGIRDLWIEPRVHNGSRIETGDHMFRYVAEDWHGNRAECRFLVSIKSADSSENGWSSELRSRVTTNTPVIIGASVVGIMAIALLVILVVVFRLCRRARILRNRPSRTHGTVLSTTQSQQLDACLSEPPPYEVAAIDKLPDYKPRDDPPIYEDICNVKKNSEEIGGCTNPIYTISGSSDNIHGVPVNTNTIVTDV
ncbi:uncharacterized protein LOC133204268 [Saccostrea echinata]|uniref:uncharacterized protein LOC133204268 n=1 Tax=Saccostrea echinata TaxID=191078 RepID=UPI002A7FF5CB|nr:uncharacterized protein LOC133204268 [Saccostrea echinata]